MTVSTFNPTVDSGLNLDSWITWTNLRAGTAANGIVTASPSIYCSAWYDSTGPHGGITRCIFIFDISAISAGEAISAVTFSLKSKAPGWGSNNISSHPPDLSLVGATPASTTAIVVGDYDQLGLTLLSDTVVSIDTFNATEQFYPFALNATGLSYVQTAYAGSKIVCLGIRPADDFNDTYPPSPDTSSGNMYCYTTADGTAGNRPILSVTHAPASVPVYLQGTI